MGETAPSEEAMGYKPVLNIADAREKAKAMSAAEKRLAIDSARIEALVKSLSRQNNVIVEYDPTADTTYVAAQRSGTRYLFGVDGPIPCIFPMNAGWTIENLLADLGRERVIYENAPMVDSNQPLASDMFGCGKKYRIPYSSSSVRIRKGQVTFWSGGISWHVMRRAVAYEIPNGDKGIPEAVSFDMTRKPTWHYPKQKEKAQ